MELNIRWMVIDVLIKVTIVLLAAELFAAGLSRASAACRHLIWLIASIAVLFMPAMCLLLPAWHVLPAWTVHQVAPSNQPTVDAQFRPDVSNNAISLHMPPSGESAHWAELRPPHVNAAQNADGELREPSPKRIATTQLPHSRDVWPLILRLIWSSGFVLLLLRPILSWAALRRIAADARLIDQGLLAQQLARSCAELNLRRPVELRIGSRHSMPMMWGILRPVVMLPAAAEDWPASRVRQALLHELAHVKRWDSLAQLIDALMCAVYWFHPLAWVAAAGLRREQERAADDRVLSLDAPAPDYAAFLLELATSHHSRWTGGNMASAMARRAAIETRIRAVLDTRRANRALTAQNAVIAVSVAIALIGPMAAISCQTNPTPAKQASTQPTADEVRYVGHILSVDGMPVASAEVFLHDSSTTGTQVAELAHCQSGMDGAFALPPVSAAEKQGARSIQVWASGFVVVSATARATTDQVIRVAPATSVRLRFLDSNDVPVSGLRVMPVHTIPNSSTVVQPSLEGIQYYSGNLSTLLSRTTDADGTCIFDMFPRISLTIFRIDDQRFAQLFFGDAVQTGTGRESTPVTIHLEPAGVISGKVTYGTTGKPAPGIKLLAIDRKGRAGYGGDGAIVTNERGEYHIGQVRAGDYVIHLGHNSKDIGWTATFLRVDVAPGQAVTNQNLVLVKGAVVSGRLYEADTGRPFANAYLAAVDVRTDEYPASTYTDADGRYVMRLPPGEEGIYLGSTPPAGYSSEDFSGRGHKFRRCTVVDGADLTVDLELTPAAGEPVTGHVIDVDGKPVSGVTVRAIERAEDEIHYGISTQSDGDGRFSFRSLAPGTKLTAQLGSAGTLSSVKVNGGEGHVILTIAKNIKTSVSGTVTDPAGRPITDAAIRLSVMWEHYGLSDGQASTLTDSAGRFTIAGLKPGGHYSIDVTADGYSGAKRPLEFTPGQEQYDVGLISLDPKPVSEK